MNFRFPARSLETQKTAQGWARLHGCPCRPAGMLRTAVGRRLAVRRPAWSHASRTHVGHDRSVAWGSFRVINLSSKRSEVACNK